MNIIYEDLRYLKDCFRYWLLGKVNKNKDMATFQNKHQGERCFIVATGPSLTIEDVEALRNETTFAVNSCFRIFTKTDWRPTYYVVADPKFITDLGTELEQNNDQIPCAFCGDGVNWKKDGVIKFNASKKYQHLPTRGMLRRIIDIKKENFMSTDASKGIIAGHTVIFSVLQIAYYMGFSEINLIGTDCNYSGMLQYSSLTNHTHINKPNAADLMIVDYYYVKRHFDKFGISVYNATRGGMLDVFERVALEKVLSKKN